MRLNRFASLSLLVVTPALVHCEVVEAPPPAAPQPAPPPPQQPPPPPPPEQGAAPPAANGQYASQEYQVGAEAPPADSYEDNDPAALSDFHGALDSYGTWVDDPTYGTVWVPSSGVVGPDFTPYSTGGHWSYDNDYVWESDYAWGWAPFHYGRWVFIDGRGWSWIPGRAYRGSWVTWGVDDGFGYAGWYPLAPAFVWRGGVAIGYTAVVEPRWNYVPRGELFSPVVGTRVLRGSAAVAVSARVRPFAAGVGVAAGPPPAKFGYNEHQIPHPSQASVGKAQQFAHPSTATALGARPPTRTTPSAAPANNNPRFANVRPANQAAVPQGRPGPQPQPQRTPPARTYNPPRAGGHHGK